MPKIYVASSWRNVYYEQVVQSLRGQGFEVYDFRNPTSVASGSSACSARSGVGLSACGAFPPSRSVEDASAFSTRSGVGFHWTDVDKNAPNWTFEEYAEGLHHPKAERQFAADLQAMLSCDTCVLVLPCGRSAHTEAGWFAGAGKRVIAYIPEMGEPELMYKLFDGIVGSLDDLIRCLGR